MSRLRLLSMLSRNMGKYCHINLVAFGSWDCIYHILSDSNLYHLERILHLVSMEVRTAQLLCIFWELHAPSRTSRIFQLMVKKKTEWTGSKEWNLCISWSPM